MAGDDPLGVFDDDDATSEVVLLVVEKLRRLVRHIMIWICMQQEVIQKKKELNAALLEKQEVKLRADRTRTINSLLHCRLC